VQDTDPIPASRARELTDWLRLEQAPGVGRATAARLLAAFGSPERIFGATPAELAALVTPAQARSLAGPMPPELARLVEATLAWLAIPGNHLLTLSDAAYPALLANIPDPPLLLYIKGRIELLAAPALAIIGSRNASSQGKANARGFARTLSEAGLAIVSGLALGIDAAAHEGALAGAASTIAVVGTGADIIYPQGNTALARRIAQDGCIVSEYALGTPPLAANFPRRNRVISGLAAGVLVVEAAARSGSLITAHLALEQGREVFAIPGSIHAALSKGCNQLIREGAQLVESAGEILQAMCLSPLAGRLAPAAPAHEGEGVLAALGADPVTLDTLLAGTDPGALHAQLLALEMAGLVERLPGGMVQRVYR
jgi:DNA processing protein